jgi:protein phosphatase 1 regulatory subunit 7
VTEIVQLPPDPDTDDSDDERNPAVDPAPTDGDGAPDDDFLATYPADTEELHLQHLRLENSSLPPLRLPRFTQLTRLCLRQNELSSPLPAECLELGALEDLDLYDNRLGPRVEDEELKGVGKVT